MKVPWNKGVKMPQTTKDKISASRKGKGIAWNKGKNWSSEIIEKMSNAKKGSIPWNKGKLWSKSVKEKIRRTKLAKTIDIKTFYERNRPTNRQRALVLSRDEFKCTRCGRGAKDTVDRKSVV